VEKISTNKTYLGTIASQDDSLLVTGTANQALTVAKADVAALRSHAEQRAHEKAQHPVLLEGWTGGANVGFGLTAGNSQTESLG
jgi:hypothetical protein